MIVAERVRRRTRRTEPFDHAWSGCLDERRKGVADAAFPVRSLGATPVDATTGASSGTSTAVDADDAGARARVGGGRSISWSRASLGLSENAITSRGIGQLVTGDHHGAVANTASTSA